MNNASSRLLRKLIAPIFLILMASFIGYCFPIRAVAQDAGDCPTGTIGDCTSLEVINTRCSGFCTVYDPTFGWYSISCERTYYQCYEPQVKPYTIGECDFYCYHTE